MALPPAGPLPPWWPIPPGYVRLGLLPARRRLLPGLSGLSLHAHSSDSSDGNKAISCCAKPSSRCICPPKCLSQSAE